MFQKQLHYGIPNVTVWRYENVYTYRRTSYPTLNTLNDGQLICL
jgi:hypothetical protein